MQDPAVWTGIFKHLAVGGVLFYGVQKFFKEIEEKLNDDTKLEIAVWLLGVQTSTVVQDWPETFARVFDRVFGSKHLSWICFWRSTVASAVNIVLCFLILIIIAPGWLLGNDVIIFVKQGSLLIVLCFLTANILPSYVALLVVRYMIQLIRRFNSWVIALLLILLNLTVTRWLARLSYHISVYTIDRVLNFLMEPPSFETLKRYINLSNVAALMILDYEWLWYYPTFFTSIWLWLYTSAGFVLKAARRLDLGFKWFNSRMDIESKPLQSIGLVAGAITAVAYWGAMILIRLM